MNELKKLVMILLNYNTPDLTVNLARQLDDWFINVVVVDNNSSDDSVNRFKQDLSGLQNVELLFLQKNGGYAKGNNAGIEFALELFDEIEYIGIINPDIEIQDVTTLLKLINALKEDNSLAGITALTILNSQCSKINECAAKLLSPLQLIISDVFGLKKLIKRGYTVLKANDDDVAYVDKIQGCFFIMKKQDFSDIGYFDNGTFLYYEEDIIAEKIRKNKKHLGVLVSESIKHNHEIKEKEMTSINKRKFYNSCALMSKKYYMINILHTPKIIWFLSYILDKSTRFIKDLFLKIREIIWD